MGSLKRLLFAVQNVFRAVTDEIELRGFASTPMRIAQIIAIGLEYWNDGLRRKKEKILTFSF